MPIMLPPLLDPPLDLPLCSGLRSRGGSRGGSSGGSRGTSGPTSGPTAGPVNNDIFVPGPTYITSYYEDATPIPIVDRNSIYISDPDVYDEYLYQLEVVMEEAVDTISEGILLDGPAILDDAVFVMMSMSPWFSPTESCSDVTFPANTSVLLSFSAMLIPSAWKDVVRSLRYCNRDKNITSGNRTVSFRILDHPGGNWSKPVYTIIRGFSVNNPPIYSPPANYSELFTIKEDHNQNPSSIDVDHLYTIQEGQVLDITFKTRDVGLALLIHV